MSGGGETSCGPHSEPKTGKLRHVMLGDVLELFRDPEAETASEGYAKVWAIQEEDDEYYTLIVSFMNDPTAPARKFTRKYKKYGNTRTR